jgi:hypothetical protein
MYGYSRDIHTIHRLYYYYESIYYSMNNLEFKTGILYNEEKDLHSSLRGNHFHGRIQWT